MRKIRNMEIGKTVWGKKNLTWWEPQEYIIMLQKIKAVEYLLTAR